MKNQNALVYALLIMLIVSMFTNDNCEVKEVGESVLQPFFFNPRAELWEE